MAYDKQLVAGKLRRWENILTASVCRNGKIYRILDYIWSR